MYSKGEFKGLICVEFASDTDRDAAIQYVKNSGRTLGTDSVWAKVERPVEERVPLSILGRAKQLFIKWGIPKEKLWVDRDTKTLSYDNREGIKTQVIEF